ncbi:MAG: peptide deformylase [Candidatus Melainabacteria bacterium]|nr:peptide deformylase [Candidatus Melainabacteria bacterium]
MAILPVLVYPDPELKRVSDPVDFKEDLTATIQDLLDTMHDAPGCVGLAAPQCGVRKRILIIDASRNPKVESKYGLMVIINPIVEYSEGEVLAREGCLSLPDLTANVKRAQKIRVKFQNPQNQEQEIEVSDFEARVVLHELDHLDGILFLDRVASLKTDVFRRKRYAPKDGAGKPGEVKPGESKPDELKLKDAKTPDSKPGEAAVRSES